MKNHFRIFCVIITQPNFNKTKYCISDKAIKTKFTSDKVTSKTEKEKNKSTAKLHLTWWWSLRDEINKYIYLIWVLRQCSGFFFVVLLKPVCDQKFILLQISEHRKLQCGNSFVKLWMINKNPSIFKQHCIVCSSLNKMRI